jgi:hypothetical protein
MRKELLLNDEVRGHHTAQGPPSLTIYKSVTSLNYDLGTYSTAS